MMIHSILSKSQYFKVVLLAGFFALSACSQKPVQGTVTESSDRGQASSAPAQTQSEAGSIAQPTASPVPTKTTEPTSTPQPSVPSRVEFGLNTASQELPDNLMDQITYFGQPGGGGGGDSPCFKPPGGGAQYEYEPRTETCQYCDLNISTSGWAANEKIRITVQLEGGESFKETLQADKCGYFSYNLPATADDLPGEYTIALNGSSGKLKTDFYKIAPDETGATLVGDQLLLYNFVPLEKFTLVIYQVSPADSHQLEEKFVGWQEFQVDAGGSQRITLDLGSDASIKYLIDAEKSGIYPRYTQINSATQEKTITYESFGCGKLESAFKLGDQLQVIFVEGAPFYFSLEPLAETIFSLEPAGPDRIIKFGEPASVIGGPICFDGWIYWQVELDDQSAGWVPQGLDDIPAYFEIVK